MLSRSRVIAIHDNFDEPSFISSKDGLKDEPSIASNIESPTVIL
jgi:hypothetical protein